MAQVYGAGGKTVPKQGRLGTGSYWPDGTPLYLHKGNVFPGIQVRRPDFVQLNFGDPSRAGIATKDRRNTTAAILPNQSFYNTATLPLAPAMVVSSANEANNLQPVTPAAAKLLMPHERNTNSASGTHKRPLTFRTAFGASRTMPTDTAFQHNPSAMYRHMTKPRAKAAIEAVKVQAAVRTFARPANPLPVSGGTGRPRRTPPPSFQSSGQQWSDPNNSFLAGVHNTLAGRTGTGRWSIVKRGVV